MLDSIAGGLLECGFARAFRPLEFDRFGIHLNESKSCFSKGIEQVRRLLSDNYPGYDKIIEMLSKETFESQVEKYAAWVGTPERLNDAIAEYLALIGLFEVASLQINFNTIPVEEAERSMRLFAEKVIPNFTKQ